MQMSNIPTLLAYVCDSHYRVETLGFNVLKGKDQLRGACLKDVCSQIGMDVYIADLNRKRSGSSNYLPLPYDDHSPYEIDEMQEDKIILTKIVDLYGNIVESDASLEEEENFIQSDAFEDDPYSEGFNYINEIVTHCYRKTVSPPHF